MINKTNVVIQANMRVSESRTGFSTPKTRFIFVELKQSFSIAPILPDYNSK